MTVFEAYKPFRNRIIQLELIDTLHFIWARSNYNQFDIYLPSNFRNIIAQPFLTKPHKLTIMLYNGLDHELDTILIEVLRSTNGVLPDKHTLKNPEVLKKVLRDLRRIDNFIFNKIKPYNDIFRNLQRIAHQQFIWQERVNNHTLFPYYSIYNDEKVVEIVKEVIGLSTFEIFVIGIIYTFRFQRNFMLIKDQKSNLKNISTDSISLFLKTFSVDIKDIREKIKQTHSVDEKVLYMLNPLRSTPILVYGNHLMSPMPIQIFWAITNGLFYRLSHHKSFGNYYGIAFQNLIGKVLSIAINKKALNCLKEEEYYVRKKRKDTLDWIVYDNDEVLLIECKTRKMSRMAQFSIEPDEIEADIINLTNIVKQAYTSYSDFQSNFYPQIKFSEKYKVRILILTLENWFIELNRTDYQKVKDKLKDIIPLEHLEKVPFYVKSMALFLTDIQIINKLGLKRYFELFETEKIQDFRNTFESKNLFDNAFEEILLKPLKENGT